LCVKSVTFTRLLITKSRNRCWLVSHTVLNQEIGVG